MDRQLGERILARAVYYNICDTTGQPPMLRRSRLVVTLLYISVGIVAFILPAGIAFYG